MGYWGWRRLIAVFVSVWVAGCSATHDTAPTVPPTHSPQFTLTVRTPATPTPLSIVLVPSITPARFVTATPLLHTLQAGDTLLNLARRFGVPVATLEAANGGLDPRSLQIGQEIRIPDPQFDPAGLPILPTATPLSLALPPPACYPTPTNSVLCLGRVHNNSNQPVERVSVTVMLFGAGGRILAQRETGIEQAVIPAGQYAPYRALFQINWEDYLAGAAALRSAEIAQAVEGRYVSPAVENERGGWEHSRYVLAATLSNPTARPILIERVVVTLENRQGDITGYRVTQLDRPLAAGESLAVLLEVVPHTPDTAVAHHLYIEARPTL